MKPIERSAIATMPAKTPGPNTATISSPQMRAFMELLYFAGKGKLTPAEMERKTAELLERKKTVTTPMGSTNSTPNKGSKGYKNLKEAQAAAHKEFG